MALKSGEWLSSNKGEKWKIIDIKENKLTIRKFYKGKTTGTIKGIDIGDIRRYFKVD